MWPFNPKKKDRGRLSRKPPTDEVPIGADLQTDQGRLDAVFAAYEHNREFYQTEVRLYSRFYMWLTAITLAGTALTPLLLLLEKDGKELAKFWSAIPSAVAGLAAALNSTFRYRESWGQNYYTLSALINEQQRFVARASPDYSGDKTLSTIIDTFQNRMSLLVMSEVEFWRTSMLKTDTDGTTKQANQKASPSSLSISVDKPTVKQGESGVLSIKVLGSPLSSALAVTISADSGLRLSANKTILQADSMETKIPFTVDESASPGSNHVVEAKSDKGNSSAKITVDQP